MAEIGLSDAHQDGAYRRTELITGEARRRRWSREEKAEILAESFRPGICVSEVARRHGASRSLLCSWTLLLTSPFRGISDSIISAEGKPKRWGASRDFSISAIGYSG